MKKKSRDQLNAEFHAGQNKHSRSLHRRNKNYSPNGKPRSNPIPGGRHLVAPESISIYNFTNTDGDYFTGTISFTEEIRKYFGKEKCVVDFGHTKQVSAAAMIVIYAALDEARQKGTAKATIIWSQESPAVNRQLKNINIPKLIDNKEIRYNFDTMQSLPVISGTGSDHMEEIIDYIQQSVYDNDMSPEEEYVFGDAVSETINNVRLHAYPDAPLEEKRWWLMCKVMNDQLYLAIYDTGVGIPQTVLEKKWFLASLKSAFPDEYQKLEDTIPGLEQSGFKAYIPQRLKDSQMIYLSMQGDVTGTKRSKHGQGSKSIKALVEETNDGKLWVFSNKGLYTFPPGDEEEKTDIYKLPRKLPGTLVQWNIKLS